MTLFEKYGGISTVQAMVRDFYREVLDDETLAPFFHSTQMETLIAHQVDLFCYVLGGPCSFNLERLRSGHAGLKIQQAHFDRVAAILSDTLADFEVEPGDQETIMTTVASTAELIVGA